MTSRAGKGMAIMLALILGVALCVGCAQTSGSNSPNPEKIGVASQPLTGDMSPEQQTYEPEEMTPAEEEEIDRAIRSYTAPTEASPFRNKAPAFTYRELLSSDQRNVYDAIVSLFDDPTNTSCYVTARLSGISKSVLDDMVWTACDAVEYDHPELFWMHASDTYPIRYSYSSGKTTLDEVKLCLARSYHSYKEDMRDFNAAVSSFLAGIDLNQSDAMIALDIHDKLIDSVSYDYKLRDSDKSGLGHTAFGALVHNDEDIRNCAVCDGYSLAYEYLLQQVGIQATVVIGNVTSGSDDSGSHAWNLVKLDNEWYEVDSTWNDVIVDPDDVYARYLEDHPGDTDCAEHLMWSCYDEDYCYKVRHNMFNLTTSEMENFDPGDAYTYYHDDGWWTYLVSPSSRVRDGSSASVNDNNFNGVAAKLPTAYGTTYAFTNGPQNWPSTPRSTDTTQDTQTTTHGGPVFDKTPIASSVLDGNDGRYGPGNAVDGNDNTAWNEGESGNGVNAWLRLRASSLQDVEGVKIAPGYAKNEDVFARNSRPKDITILLADGNRVKHTVNYTLQDLSRGTRQYVNFGGTYRCDSITITIDSVYPGVRVDNEGPYDDCCITEVEPF